MPTPEVEALTQISDDAQTKAALSSCIATEIRAGRSAEEARAMCYTMIKEKTGKELAPQGGE